VGIFYEVEAISDENILLIALKFRIDDKHDLFMSLLVCGADRLISPVESHAVVRELRCH